MSQVQAASGVDAANAAFWNTLCGSVLARSIGVVNDKPESLARYDAWYFTMYPYLNQHVQPEQLAGKRVLEVGLGYGTVAQSLATSGAAYSGLDIAAGPVAMVNHRLRQSSVGGAAQQGSILEAPFPDQSFDAIIAIGCFHHTGDTLRAIQESWRLLAPGGRLTFMVYYAFSYRRWRNNLFPTFRHALSQSLGLRGLSRSKPKERGAYDHDGEGNPAPHTDFYGKSELRRMCRQYSSCHITLENIDQFRRWTRDELLLTAWPRRFGLDAYVTCIK